MTRPRRHIRYGHRPDDYERGFLRGYGLGALLVLALLVCGVAVMVAWW